MSIIDDAHFIPLKHRDDIQHRLMHHIILGQQVVRIWQIYDIIRLRHDQIWDLKVVRGELDGRVVRTEDDGDALVLHVLAG